MEEKSKHKPRKKKAKTKESPPPARSDTIHSMLVWIHRAVGPAFSIVGATMIFSSFMIGSVFIYIGGLICIYEILRDPQMQKYSIYDKFTAVTVVLCGLLVFSQEVVFMSVPLKVSASIYPGRHSPGITIAGIKWHTEFTDLRVSLINPTDNDYRDIDVVFEPDEPIVSIGQVSTVYGVSFIGDTTKERTGMGGVLAATKLNEAGDEIDIPMTQVSTPNYRVRCQSIPHNSAVELVLAIASCPGPSYAWRILIVLIPSTEYDKVVFIHKVPSSIKISGTYMAGKPLRRQSIDETMPVR
jgi:hypothetical protein